MVKIEGELLKFFSVKALAESGGAKEELSFVDILKELLFTPATDELPPSSAKENKAEIKPEESPLFFPIPRGYEAGLNQEKVSFPSKIPSGNSQFQRSTPPSAERPLNPATISEEEHTGQGHSPAKEPFNVKAFVPVPEAEPSREITPLPPLKVIGTYESYGDYRINGDRDQIDFRVSPKKDLYSEFKDAEGVFNIKRIIDKNTVRDVGGLQRLYPKAEKRAHQSDGQTVQHPPKAYEIELGSLPREVKPLERTEGAIPVLREAIFREEGKVKRAFVKVENIGIEVKLVRDRVDIQFSLPNGRESMLGFIDYLKISQILSSMGLRVEGFSVNGQEVNRPRLKLKEKDNINLDELTQKGRDYLNGSPSFSVAL
ncbi:hypothetical protein [Aquifex sp.]